MKKHCKTTIFMVAFFAIMGIQSAKADNTLSISDCSAKPGAKFVLPVEMNNSNEICGFSFELVLPTGVSVAKNEKEKFLFSLSERGDDHTITSNLKDGTYYVACLSLTSTAFSGSSGAICNITLQIDDSIELGEKTIAINNIELATPKATKFNPSDISCTLNIESGGGSIEPSTDISKYANILYFNDAEIRAGNDFTLELNLKNAEENITAFECKVVLPDSVIWKTYTDKRGKVLLNQPTFNTTTERSDASYHTISSMSRMSDGSYYIIVYSMNKDVFLDTDGAVLDLPLALAEGMAAGDYNLILKDLVITDVNSNQTLIDRVVSKLTVPSYIMGDANSDDMVNVTDIVTMISYMKEENPKPFNFKAADVNSDKMINVTDIVGVIDIMKSEVSSSKPAMAYSHQPVMKKAAATTGNVLEIVPFTLTPGTISKTVTLDMLNPGDVFTAFQCRVYLPTGIDWAHTVDKRGKTIYTTPTFNVAAERTDANYHTISQMSKMDDGGYLIIVYSSNNEIILDEAGAVLDLPLVFDANLAPGVYDIRIGSMVMSRTDLTDCKPADYTASVIVGSPEIASVKLYGDYTASAITELNNALKTNTSISEMDLSEAYALNSTTAFATGNSNLLCYIAEDKSIANTKNVVIGDQCAKLELTDGYNFAASKAFTAADASYSRTMTTDWGTICLPYEVKSNASVAYYKVKEIKNSTLFLEKYETLPAGTPAIVKKLSGSEIAPKSTSVSVSGEIGDSIGTVTMVGTYTNNTKVTAANAYYLKDNKFYQCNGYFYIDAFHAYFIVDSNAKVFEIADGDATGIEETSLIPSLYEEKNVYNLSGQKVNDSYKGIVINNGKKFIKK